MTILLHLDEIDIDAPLWQLLEQPETAIKDYAHRLISDLFISPMGKRRLQGAGVVTVGQLLSRTLASLGQVPQSQWALSELVEQLGAFLGVDARLVESSDFNSGLITVLTEDMVLTASADIFAQLAWDVSLAKLCGIPDVAALPAEDLTVSVDDERLDLKLRPRNGLMKGGVKTVADLLQPDVTIWELLGLRNMGTGSVWNVLIRLYRFCHRDRNLDLPQVRAGQQSSDAHHTSASGFYSDIIGCALRGEVSSSQAMSCL